MDLLNLCLTSTYFRSLDRADQLSDESLARMDLIDHGSENGFTRKEHHRSKILI